MVKKDNVKTPTRLPGFRDFFCKDVKLREFVIKTFKKEFEKYGYEPLETPALEKTELVLGQSGEEAEKQYYRFRDPGGRDVMLRYEVMIGMCRAVAQNINNITFPYKRYQIQPVWRAEKPQKGRFREFLQCDADTVGSASKICDGEFIEMGIAAILELGIKDVVVKINSRKFLEGLAEYFELPKEKFYDFYISLDKLEKIGKESVLEEMIKIRKIDEKIAKKMLEMLIWEEPLKFEDKVKKFKESVGKTKAGKEGIKELLEIDKYLKTAQVDEKFYTFSPSLARGLASYTGGVWEFVVPKQGIGSLAGGGRYDKAIEKYIGIKIPATGGSFGIDRICDVIEERRLVNIEESPAKVLVTIFNEDISPISIKVAKELRSNGISTMLYPEAKNLDKQLRYADKKKIPYVLIIGPDEKEKNIAVLRWMRKNKQQTLPISTIIEILS